ncbi:peptidase inhibitor family I36 protein [Streptomyces sp. NBC_01275]|uniref:peptidase inhibitor family I36 protein n=1 Tax=Streptomyces sp. NBC_01275 TaxID=2903807 RepID=UPI00338F2935
MAALAGNLVALPTEAQAAWKCPDGYFCMYENSNYTGSVAVIPEVNEKMSGYTGGIANLRNAHFTNGKIVDDAVSSVVNNTSQNIFFYSDHDYNSSSGENPYVWGPTVIRPHQGWPTMNALENDNIGSISVGQKHYCGHVNFHGWKCGAWISDRN